MSKKSGTSAPSAAVAKANGRTTSARFPGWWAAVALHRGTTLTRMIADATAAIAAALETVTPADQLADLVEADREIINFPAHLLPKDAAGFRSPTARLMAATGKALRLPGKAPKTVHRICLFDRIGEPLRYLWVPVSWGTGEIKTGLRRDRQQAVHGWCPAPRLPVDTSGAALSPQPWYARPARTPVVVPQAAGKSRKGAK